MRRPTIGIIPLMDVARDSYWMLPGYMQGIIEAGGLPAMLPLTSDRALLEQMADEYDGFLFSGGHDLMPSMYGEEAVACEEFCPERDEMESILFSYAYEKDKASFGICRGLQFINVALGGTLYQDLPSQRPGEVTHRQPAPYDEPCHPVELVEGSPLQSLLKQQSIGVNSCHHQGIKGLSPQLQSMGTAPDGLIEAVWAPEKRFVWAVQWHPEFSFRKDEDSRVIFKRFVEACKG